MILFLKHIWRTIKKSPLQPLLILLTLTVAISASVTALRMQEVFSIQAEANKQKFTAAGDILISPSADSTIRMLFEEDAKEIVGQRGEVLGEYALTFFKKGQLGNHLISASCLDLEAADRFYDFKFTEYGEFTDVHLKKSAVISTLLSEKYDLHVGDSLSISIFGENLSFTVQAVAKPTGILSSRDMLVSKNALLTVLSSHIPVINALGDAFSPNSRLMIRANSEAEIESIAEDLKRNDQFADYYIETPYTKATTDFFVTFQSLIAAILGTMILMLSVMLILGSMNLLQIQRQKEYALFALAGASEGQATALLMIECLIYALIGGIGGVLLAKPMLGYAGDLFSFVEHNVSVGRLGCLFGLLLSLSLMIFCVLWQRRRAKRVPHLAILADQTEYKEKTQKKKGFGWSIPTLLLILLLSILLLPVKLRFITAFASVFLCMILLFTKAECILAFFFGLLQKFLDRQKNPSPSLLLSTKNICHNRTVRHVGRLFATLFSLVMIVSACYSTVKSQASLFQYTFRSEISALNVPDDTITSIQKQGLADGVCSLGVVSSVELPGGSTAIAIALSGDAEQCMHPDLVPIKTPIGNEILLSKGIASMIEKSVGDSFTATIQGKSKEFTVIGIQDVNSNLIFLDANAIPTSSKIVTFKLSEAANAEELLTRALESDGVAVIDQRQIWGSVPITIGGFMELTFHSALISVILALLGCMTVLAQQYHARKRERELLCFCGAEKKRIFGIYFTEFLLIFVSSLVLAFLFYLPAVFCVDIGLRSFGFVLF